MLALASLSDSWRELYGCLMEYDDHRADESASRPTRFITCGLCSIKRKDVL